jgi:hypothetical protein
MSHFFAIWIVLTQGSTAIIPRKPIFDQTAVSGTVLLLTPLLKSTTLFVLSENNRELGRAERLKRFVQPLADFQRHGLAIMNFRSALIGGARVGLAVRAASRAKSSPGSGDLFLSTSRTGPNCCESTGRVVSRSMKRSAYARGPTLRVTRIAGSRSMLPDPLF